MKRNLQQKLYVMLRGGRRRSQKALIQNIFLLLNYLTGSGYQHLETFVEYMFAIVSMVQGREILILKLYRNFRRTNILSSHEIIVYVHEQHNFFVFYLQ